MLGVDQKARELVFHPSDLVPPGRATRLLIVKSGLGISPRVKHTAQAARAGDDESHEAVIVERDFTTFGALLGGQLLHVVGVALLQISRLSDSSLIDG